VFRRTARRYSICADDAEDAYQRALEILLTKAPPIEGDALVRWMQTVTKREALGVRRQRERLLGKPRKLSEDDDRDPLDSLPADQPDPTDRAARRERVAKSGEALRALKPQEARALTLKAEGYSYAEIGEITGWTYTKINRCMAEGRKRFLEVFADIEHGRRCERHAAALSALADGELEKDEAHEVHLHLRSCGSCRAKLRAFRGIPRTVFELLPTGTALDQTSGARVHEWIGERLGAAADKAREAGYALVSRGAGDGAGQVAASGGTRGAGMAALGKLLAVCGATAAGSAACVATGVVDPGSIGVGGDRDKAALEQPDRSAETPLDQQVGAPPVVPDPSSTERDAQPTPAEQSNKNFGFETSASGSTAGGEFGGPSTGGSSGSGGSSGGGSGGFGFEK
jgi:RNA polymerase sigma factor (sigma-70 family)